MAWIQLLTKTWDVLQDWSYTEGTYLYNYFKLEQISPVDGVVKLGQFILAGEKLEQLKGESFQTKNDIRIHLTTPLREARKLGLQLVSFERDPALNTNWNVTLYAWSELIPEESDRTKALLEQTSLGDVQLELEDIQSRLLGIEQQIAVILSRLPEPPPPPTYAIRINCGGSAYTDSQGNQWIADQYFAGGGGYNIEQALGQTVTITGTSDPTIYKFERSGNSGYTIPLLQAGTYTVRLHFCENYYSSINSRVGNVYIQGAAVLSNFDILKETTKHAALIKIFANIQLTNQCAITMNGEVLLNGIEVIRTA